MSIVEPTWLPELVLFEEFSGNWPAYEEFIYDIFSADFIANRPIFSGLPVGYFRDPIEKNKVASFWHATTTGKKEAERIPDIRRCERIRWIKAIIENIGDPEIRYYKNIRKGRINHLLWLYKHKFVVVLGERPNHFILVTAHFLNYSNAEKDFQREYEEYIRINKR